MEEIRYIAATGSVGGGVDRDALMAALDYDPHFIAADAGTTDAGAFSLGRGVAASSRSAVKRDLSVMLEAGLRVRVPVIVGSAGTAGADAHVDWVLEIVKQIGRELGERLVGAAIYSEQHLPDLADSLAAGRLIPLGHAKPLGLDGLQRCERVVAMLGAEPLQEALAGEPQFIIAGRCSDAALYAALPLMHGFPPALAWHAGKVVESGTLACESARPGVMLVTLGRNSFSVRPIGADLRCTTQSVAAQSLYENAHPYLFAEPSGTLDITASTYEQQDEVTVRVSGSQFVTANDYSVKLEGAELLGFQSMIVGGVRDPLILSQLDSWLDRIHDQATDEIARFMQVAVDDERYRIGFHVYGRDAVMGQLESGGRPGHEVGIVCTTLAPTQDRATEMARLCHRPLLHAPIPEWKGSITGFACLHSPAWIELGPLYRFALNHVLLLGSGQAVHRLKRIDVPTGDRPRLVSV